MTVTATSQTGPTKSASATIRLKIPPYSLRRNADQADKLSTAIAIDHTKVSNTDQVNFPFLFDSTDPAFATTANGGHVQFHRQRYFFSTDPNGLTKLDHELEEYNPVTGQVVAWIASQPFRTPRIPPVCVLGKRQHYNLAADPTGVWDSNYMGVWHVANNGGQLSLVDSTSNANNATNNGAISTAGKLDGGMKTNGSTYATRDSGQCSKSGSRQCNLLCLGENGIRHRRPDQGKDDPYDSAGWS